MDLRGWGASDAPGEGYALADFADDVRRLITERGLSNFVLIGHSMGGKIAQLVASRQPRGLAGLVLVAPSPPTPLGLPPEYVRAWKAPIRRRLPLKQRSTMCSLRSAHRRSAAAGDRGQSAWRRGGENRMARATRVRRISRRWWARLRCPPLVIAGELDRVDSVSTLETELLARIPRAVMRVAPGNRTFVAARIPAGRS